MINSNGMLERARYVYRYGMENEVDIDVPLGVEAMPKEWETKIGTHYLDQPYLAVLEDVHLCGNAMVGLMNNDVVLDTAYYGRIDLWERNSPYFESAMAAMAVEPIEIDLAMSFVGVWSHNYFHWILDHLPKLEAIDLYRQETGENPTLLIATRPPGFIEDAITQLPYNWQRIAHPHYIINRLLVATTRRKKGVMYPDALRYLENMFHVEHLYTSPSIYISRRLARNRNVLNEDDLDEYLLHRGFQILTTERMSFFDQVGRMKKAKNLVSPHGAGLANMVWGKQMNVIELVQPEYTNPCLWLVGAVKGNNYGYVIGDAEKGENLSISISKLDGVLEAMQ